MPTDEEYVERIGQYHSHGELLALIDGLQYGSDPFWSLGKAFEYGLVRAFELENVPVKYPYHITGIAGGLDEKPGIIEQIDGVVYVDPIAAIIESKDYDQPIDIEPIAKLRFRLERRPTGTIGVIFSRKGITRPAAYLLRNSQPKNILLWQQKEIGEALRRKYMSRGLISKYRHMVEYGLPDYNLLREFET